MAEERSFRDLEELFFKETLAKMRVALRRALEWLDQKLFKKRDLIV